MHVAVVIVGFRNARDIAGCLKALDAQTYADFEVVVCENGGPAAFEALQAAAPNTLAGGQPVRLVQASHNLGYAGGINLAMAQAPGADAWWMLNPDTEAEPGALAALAARLARGDCEAVGCTLYTPDGRVQAYGGRWQRLLGRAVSIGRGRLVSDPVAAAEVERAQNFISGASALIGRRFFEAVGPMREDYFLYCEEVEWFLRGGAHGMRLGFAPDARVRHDAGSTTGSNRAFREMPKTPIYLNERNRILLTRDLTPALAPVVAAGAAGVFLARYGRRGAWRQLGYALAGWAAGLRNRRGSPAWIPAQPGA
ncbi:MAG: glycosyltransferase family 2 protein [Phenylobacterium sp.]|uniref:glycosyltransferase family 2 protein n=1 Tax=Phenylobacterium sp. TaxID=1871053 RepID=UPI001A55DAD8|nr:glycosyltransferase family 2 protein [Phenylobacterium sp.]MBL8554512.1 glycosyltransferase family 2 protein [Phenylobacterium sp.]